jgi:hypothetical protein
MGGGHQYAAAVTTGTMPYGRRQRLSWRAPSGPAEPRFTAVATGSRAGVPRLKRANADRCLNFFQRLVNVTGDEAENQFP